MIKPETSSTKTRKFKMGSFSLVTSAVCILVAIAINIGVAGLPVSFTQHDITRGQVFEISDLSKSVAASLNEEITIFWIVTEGNEDTNLMHFLERYDELSGYINLERVDPTQYPAFVNSITDIVNDNSLYVQSEKYGRYIDYQELYTEEYKNGYGTDVNYLFHGDSCITSAVDYVTSGEETVLYILGGHGEGMMSSDYVSAIENKNITIKDLSLISDGKIPDDADAIFLCAPAGDISREEEEILLEYLGNGGRMMLVTYPTDGDEHHNIEDLMSNYGLSAVHGYVLEGDSRYMVGDMPTYVLPTYSDHKIVEPLADSGYYVVLFAPQGLVYNDNERDTLSVIPLLYSSDQAYAKPNGNVTTYDREDTDIGGPFILAAAIDETVNGINTRIVWITSDAVLADDMNQMVSGGNQDLLLNSLSYLCKSNDSALSISPKSLEYEYMMFTGSQGTAVSIIAIGIIPLIYMIIGLVIYMKRKKK